ncbi:hypothetical protein PILCRDRAFT_813244 [Piloderma croceum F 1598]|uniref:Protein kinase domain-containing protein n=1 Tax=Piloderma croceum (strain F 1598) TaxID=765440 RepID=A0A0C3CHP2_PILCF|nr:hypothetical protein PILCRDRAFT_813244 [Piloderma croceum F 1598]
MSPPHTPPGPVDLSPPRHTSLTPSDDSSIIELSFDYEFDSAGNYVRVSKGCESRSDHSSPPTPQDPVPTGITRAKSALVATSTSPSGDSPSAVRRASLSRSESYPIMTGAEQQRSQPPTNPAAAARSFQRVVSGSVLPSAAQQASTSTSTTTRTTTTNNLRGTSSRKISARAAALPQPGPQRVTIEQYREMDEKIRMEDEEMRVARERELALLKREREEKENVGAGMGGDGEGEYPVYQSKHQQRQSGLSPRLAARSASTSQIQNQTQQAPSEGLVSRITSAPIPTSTSSGRQILPGPNRAGRILMGAKYTASSSSSVTTTSTATTTSSIANGAGQNGTGMGGFERINEQEPFEDAGDLAGVLDFYGPEETDIDEPPPLPLAPSNGVKHRSYAFGVASSGITGTGSGSGTGIGTRPRRSASLSDAGADERQSSPHPPTAASNQYMNRPGSSLGINGYVNGNGNGVNGVGRARRVTMEERYRQEREREAELEEYERQLAEDAAEAERQLQQALEDDPPPPPYQHPQQQQQQQQQRQSPSPTHLSLAAHSHIRPSIYSHQRRDSDTLRNLPTSVSTQSNLGTSSSPTVVDHGYGHGHGGHGNQRLSPPTRTQLSNLQNRQNSHKRSPTAPEVSMGSGGGSGMESEREKEREVRSRQLQQQAPPPRPTSVPAPPPANQAAAAPTPVPSRQLTVNKKVYARLDMIGKGGSSRVYRVMNIANEIYAIKRVSLDKTDVDTMSGYMNEIALLKRLDGNNRIIQLVDSELRAGPGGSKGHLLLVMECGEIDLARLLQEQQKEPMNMVWISYYWQQMLQAVHVIHEEKIVHSDLKPANFVLVRGQLKLIDFGIANAIANDTTNIQRDHQIGTVNYMSPEAIELPDGMRRLKVGRPSDVWSLGCILYQMVYGHPPFQHLSVFQKMKAIPDLTHTIDFPKHSTPSIPTRSSGQTTITPKRLEHLKIRVRGDVIMSMKSCLCRNPKERAAIPELLDQDWLAMKESEPPAAKPELAQDETIINPYYMRQLLTYGIKLGQQRQNVDMDPDQLLKEAERLVAELKALES